MNEVVITSVLMQLFMAVVALFFVWAILRIFDKLTGASIKDAMEKMNGQAIAIYYGARFVGACILVGSILS